MKLYQKVKKDVENALKKGYSVAVSYGSYQTYCKLKGLDPSNFEKNIDSFNVYLQKHGIAAVKTRKGLRYTTVGKLKEYKPKSKKDDGLEL